MRIRTQMLLSAALAALVAVVVAIALIHVTRQTQLGLDERAEAQQVVRHIMNMQSLTNEFSVHGGERVIAQWRSRHAQLQAAIDEAARRRTPLNPLLAKMRTQVAELPVLFDKLAEIERGPPSETASERRQLLIERLLGELQEVVEARHRWSTSIGEAQRSDQRQYTVIVMAAPAVLLALLLSLGILIARRVLLPAARLQAAATAIRNGDLGARCASDARDELGDAARAVDAMAQALQQQTAALQTSERRLQLITDSMPAFIAHIDTAERYTFVNAHFGRAGVGDPATIIGRSVREVRGAQAYAELAPHLALVFSGQATTFEVTGLQNGVPVHRESTYVPDLDASGRVRGFYALTLDITERKEAELRQAAIQRLLVDVTDNLPALVAYIDKNERYQFANVKYREWLGVDHHAMVGRHVSEAVSDDFYRVIQEHADAALAGERVQWERHAVRDGREQHFLASYIPDLDADGQTRGFYALTVDITERREAELAMARSEQRLLDLTNSIPAMVGYFDMESRCQYANDTALRSQGLKRSDVPGITLRAALGEANYAQHEPFVRQALAGRRARLDGRIPFQGREAHFQAHLIPDRLDGGEQRGYYLMTFDVTALKEAQQRQARVERQLRAITDNLPVLITYVDRDERYLFVNATVKEWVGVEPEALIGRHLSETMTPTNYEQRRAHIRTALAGQRVEFEIESTALDRTRSLQSVYVPDIQSDGSVAGVYTLSTDITALKEIERQLSQLARVDALTNLPNRRQFEERLAEAVARSSRDKRPIALMFLDVDHFKSINDTWGHAAGDAVLKEFARRLKRAVRLTDTPARLAGDEFVVLLEGIHGEDDAALVAEKLVASVRMPFFVDGMELRVTTSVGVAYAPRPAPDSGLMQCADEALYEAKGAGRDTFRMSHIDAFDSRLASLSAA